MSPGKSQAARRSEAAPRKIAHSITSSSPDTQRTFVPRCDGAARGFQPGRSSRIFGTRFRVVRTRTCQRCWGGRWLARTARVQAVGELDGEDHVLLAVQDQIGFAKVRRISSGSPVIHGYDPFIARLRPSPRSVLRDSSSCRYAGAPASPARRSSGSAGHRSPRPRLVAALVLVPVRAVTALSADEYAEVERAQPPPLLRILVYELHRRRPPVKNPTRSTAPSPSLDQPMHVLYDVLRLQVVVRQPRLLRPRPRKSNSAT